MDEKTILAARIEIRNAIKAQRNAAKLTQKDLAEKLTTHHTQISKYETGDRVPSWEELQRIFKACEMDAASVLDKLGLSEEEYDWIRDWKVAQPDTALQLHDAYTINDVNQWLVEDVLNRGRGRPPSLGDLDKLYSSITQTLASARRTATTYPAHPLTRNNQIVQPRDGIHPSLSLPSLQSLRQGYFGEGPRITALDGLSQKTWLVEIFNELAKPIVKRGGEKGALAKVILST